jgi:hypothetical protein
MPSSTAREVAKASRARTAHRQCQPHGQARYGLLPSLERATRLPDGSAFGCLTCRLGRNYLGANLRCERVSVTARGSDTDENNNSTGLVLYLDHPTGSLRWSQGVNNVMTYFTGDIPVGLYNSQQLANLGIEHGAIDAGGGYTYFDPQKGHEFSAVIGATYNLINPSTQYRNGIDAHLDWGASQFLSANLQVGAVGYVYDQVTGDSGSGAKLGPFVSRVIGIGPQIGYLFPVAGMQGYVNLKAYGEFDARNRPSGWNAWLTLSISPMATAALVAAKN